MSKDKLSDYDGTTAGNNTDIGGISIAEGMLPSAVNNSMRELTRQLGAFANGTEAVAGISLTGNATFGDNDKAVFGAGSDLQIYHDSNNSYVQDQGTGSLRLGSDSVVQIGKATAWGELMAQFTADGGCELRHDNSAKLNTTSSGIDVTGTVTADGLGVGITSPAYDAHIHESDSGNSLLHFTNATTGTTGSDGFTVGLDASEQAILLHRENTSMVQYTNGTQRLRLENNGDISFYDSTGVTQGLFWDASTQRLGLGTTSPGTKLEVDGTITFGTADSTIKDNQLRFNPSGDAFIDHGTTGQNIKFRVSNSSALDTTALTITSGGNVGIGTSSPSNPLTISSSTQYNGLNITNGTNTIAEVVGFAAGNDAGGIKLHDGGTSKVQILTNSVSYFNGGNVGIGTAAPDGKLHIKDGDGTEPTFASDDYIIIQNNDDVSDVARMTIISGTSGASRIGFGDSGGRDRGRITYDNSDDSIGFGTNGANEHMRIDSSGNLLVGGTSLAENGAVTMGGDGRIYAIRASDTAGFFGRTSTDGSIVNFTKDGSTVGSIGTYAGDLQIGGGDTGIRFVPATDAVIPWNPSTNNARDNAVDLGNATNRFDDIFATNGTIQTSDANEKQDIEALSDAEQRVAVAAKGLLRKYRWKSSVAEKGDEARIHFGIIAQDLKAAFEAEGLDAGRYAMFINSEWTDEETGEQRSRMGVRYNQLLAFIIAAI